MRDHPANSGGAIRLYGRRIVLRPLTPTDWEQWSEVRQRNEGWLVPWEPLRPAGMLDPTRDRDAYTSRCHARDRDRQLGVAYGFGMFIGADFAGEVNLNGVVRGAQQTGTIGYWIDQAKAGNRYVAEAVVAVLRFAFEHLHLHRIEICIVPRNHNSRRVVEMLGLRDEGVALRFLEIHGTWEDHVRYAITAEEWDERRDELSRAWL
ncbi:MAG: GNAT family N-acetyltransferase [Ilumatobacteraceae bacterium]